MIGLRVQVDVFADDNAKRKTSYINSLQRAILA